MLTNLRVRNLALIQSASVEFRKGFNVLTGETGAGKSILLGAIKLLLGGRASADDVRTGEKSALIEGVFDLTGKKAVQDILRENGVETEDDTLFIKREIHAQGRNRVFINGSPAPLSHLSGIGIFLVNIHGQHELQTLLKTEEQLQAIDAFKEVRLHKESYFSAYEIWKKSETDYRALLKKEQALCEQRELMSFQSEEIKKAEIQEKEDEALEEELEILESAEKRMALVSGLLEMLSKSEYAAENVLKECARLAQILSGLDKKTQETAAILEEAGIGVREAARSLEIYADSVEYNPQRIDEIHERLMFLGRLKKKYGGTLEDILEAQKRINEQLNTIENMENEKEKLSGRVKKDFSELEKRAQKLSGARKILIGKLEKEVTGSIRKLSMDGAVFSVRLFREEKPGGLEIDGQESLFDETGADCVEMMIAPNPGEPPKPLRKIASGGELSRVMLAIKTFTAAADNVPTLIFDEIDSGIGGDTAKKVGASLQKIGRLHQVLCVTHLPTIAAQADAHFKVGKKVEKGRTRTDISQLKEKERIAETARMMGNEEKDTTIRHAKMLLEEKND